ncbi:cytochrome c oxidase assembly protein COX18, mitochondrial-like isoform X2 [Gordionus sp. m RMFG-2023]
MSFALRCLTINGPNTYVQEQLQNEGLMTFTNLCVPDPYYVLPFVLFITNLLAIELMYRRQQSFTTPLDKVAGINDISSEHKSAHIGKRGIFSDVNNRLILLKWISRCSAGVLFYISSIAPSGLTLYWLYSCLLGISQNQLLRWIYTPQRPKKLASKFYHT